MSSYFGNPIRVAPAWKMALVRAFGTRYIAPIESGGHIEYYVWFGRRYVTNYSES
jgi:hypothetical protein